jgi:hypothetical protein
MLQAKQVRAESLAGTTARMHGVSKCCVADDSLVVKRTAAISALAALSLQEQLLYTGGCGSKADATNC